MFHFTYFYSLRIVSLKHFKLSHLRIYFSLLFPWNMIKFTPTYNYLLLFTLHTLIYSSISNILILIYSCVSTLLHLFRLTLYYNSFVYILIIFYILYTHWHLYLPQSWSEFTSFLLCLWKHSKYHNFRRCRHFNSLRKLH